MSIGESATRQANQWQEDSINEDYYDDKDHKLQNYGVLLCVYGTLSLGDTSTSQFIVQYLSVSFLRIYLLDWSLTYS